MSQKVSDLLISKLAQAGVVSFYGVQGGACLHLIDSICSSKHSAFQPVLNEQSAGLCAHGHYFASGKPACGVVTTGPGFFNLITGIAACYYDNVPSVFLCGQVNSGANLAKSLGVKMYGFQEAPHSEIVKLIADTCIDIKNENDLIEAFNLIQKLEEGVLSGPLFLEIQDDFQRKFIDMHYDSRTQEFFTEIENIKSIEVSVRHYLEELKASKKPLIIVGGGTNLMNPDAKLNLEMFLEKLSVPVLFTWGAQGLVCQASKYNKGLFGTHNAGEGNAYLEDCDLLLVLGASLLQHQVGKNRKLFASKAKIIAINNGKNEVNRLKKDFGKRITVYSGNTKNFVLRFNEISELEGLGAVWSVSKKSKLENEINSQPPVKILRAFLERCPKDYAIYADAGATLSWTYQAASRCNSSKITTAFNLHTMGYSLPAAIGAATSSKKGSLVISGDGGFMMNIQELAVAKSLDMPIKILILDNQGYGIIRQAQEMFMDRRYFGSDIGGAQYLPTYDLDNICKSFKFEVKRGDICSLDMLVEWLFSRNDLHRVAILEVESNEKVKGAPTGNYSLRH